MNYKKLPCLEYAEIRHIPSFPGYAATSNGEIWSARLRHRWVKMHLTSDKRGYIFAPLRRDGVYIRTGVHRLVLEAFLGPCPAGHEGSHLDGDPSNNDMHNLIWETRLDNMRRQASHGTKPSRVGPRNGRAKLKTQEAVEMKRLALLGVPHRLIARMFLVDASTVTKIHTGSSWGHI